MADPKIGDFVRVCIDGKVRIAQICQVDPCPQDANRVHAAELSRIAHQTNAADDHEAAANAHMRVQQHEFEHYHRGRKHSARAGKSPLHHVDIEIPGPRLGGDRQLVDLQLFADFLEDVQGIGRRVIERGLSEVPRATSKPQMSEDGSSYVDSKAQEGTWWPVTLRRVPPQNGKPAELIIEEAE